MELLKKYSQREILRIRGRYLKCHQCMGPSKRIEIDNICTSKVCEGLYPAVFYLKQNFFFSSKHICIFLNKDLSLVNFVEIYQRLESLTTVGLEQVLDALHPLFPRVQVFLMSITDFGSLKYNYFVGIQKQHGHNRLICCLSFEQLPMMTSALSRNITTSCGLASISGGGQRAGGEQVPAC